MMRRNFTLPELEERLDRLTSGSLFEIGAGYYERLFGTNDAAVARLRNFARSHACVVSHSNNTILFRKQIAAVGDSSYL